MADYSPDYRSPFWIGIASAAERAVGIPPGSLQAILLEGEKTNDKVTSSAGAKTPFQIIPSTRDAILDKYGIDAYLSPENSAEAAALILKENLDRNKGNLALAAAEYHGGVDRKAWGPKTRAYVARVVSGAKRLGTGGDLTSEPTIAEGGAISTFQRVQAMQDQTLAIPEDGIRQILEAYQAGRMTPEERTEFEADVNSGAVLLPSGASLGTVAPPTPSTAPASPGGSPGASPGTAPGTAPAPPEDFLKTGVLPRSVLEAYQSERMTRQEKIDLEKDVQNGLVRVPAGFQLGKTEPLGLGGRIADVFTGSERKTPETQAAPDWWPNLPEIQTINLPQVKTLLGTALAGPQEMAQILKSNFPNLEIRQDFKGNYLIKSAIDGQTYAIKPGFRVSDIPRGLQALGIFAPAGAAKTLGGLALAGAGTQAAVETVQKMTGGTFDTAEIPKAGLLNVVIPGAVRGARAIRKIRLPGAQAVPEAVPGAQAVPETVPGAQALPEAVPGAQAVPETVPGAQAVPEAVPGAQAVPETVPGAQAVPEAVPIPTAPSSPSSPGAAVAEKTLLSDALAEINALARKAAGNSPGSTVARQKLVELSQVNQEARAASQKLGLDVPIDVFADNPQVRAAIGLTRSVVGSEAEAEWMRTLRQITAKVDETMQAYDAAFFEGSAAPGITSRKVLDSLSATQSQLKTEAQTLYEQVDKAIPKQTPAEFPKLQKTLDTIRSEVGQEGFTSVEKRLARMVSGEGQEATQATYGRLLREKNLVGKALAGKESPYGSLDESVLKRLYGALAEDQLENVARVGGEDLRKQLRAANMLTAQRKGLEKRIVGAYGKELDGGIAGLMKQSLAGNAVNTKAFNKLIKLVPPELREETLMTALAAASASKRAGLEGFAFSNFAQVYKGLRSNPEVFSQIAKVLGPEKEKFLRDLYGLSRRMVDAQSLVLTTGKANQALTQGLGPETIVARILGNPTTQKVIGVASSVIPGARLAVPPLVKLLQGPMPKEQLARIGKVFSSPEFIKLLTEAATKPQVSKKTIRSLIYSIPWREYAKEIKLPRSPSEQEKIISAAIQASREGEQKNGRK